MQRLNRLNQQRTQQRPLPVDTGHSPYDRTTPPKPWEPGWQSPAVDPHSPEHEDRLRAWAIVHHWKPTEEKSDDESQ